MAVNHDCQTINYLFLGGLFPLPPPEGLPVVLGPLGGRGAEPVAILFLLICFVVVSQFS